MEKTNFEILMHEIVEAMRKFDKDETIEDFDKKFLEASSVASKLLVHDYFTLSDRISGFIGELANGTTTTELSTEEVIDIYEKIREAEKNMRDHDLYTLMDYLRELV